MRDLGWDQKLDKEELTAWLAWIKSLKDLSKIRIPRAVIATHQEAQPTHRSLHVFCDASEHVYAAAAYCRIEYENCEVTVRLLMSKMRVAPVVHVSVPRLELLGAEMAL